MVSGEEMTTRMYSSAPVSRLSLETFNSNHCLICSVEFMKNGNINTEKINFVEVVDEGNIVKHEVVPISLTLNTVLRLPPEKQIDEDQGLVFGCCPVCRSLLSQLYGLHKKLDTLRGLDSILSKILDMNESDSLNRNPEPEKVQAKRRVDPNSELVKDSSLLTCDEVFASSDSECSTSTSDAGVTELNTLLESALQEEVEESILILAPESAAKEQCPNCCVDLLLKSRIGFTQLECSSEARRGVDAVLYKPSSVSQATPLSKKILVSDMLNNLLKLPPQNPWTRELRMCSECAPMLLRVHLALQSFENARKPESPLKLMYQDMRSFMLRRTASTRPRHCYKKTAPSFSTNQVDSTIPADLTVKMKRFVAAGITKKILNSTDTVSHLEEEASTSGMMDMDMGNHQCSVLEKAQGKKFSPGRLMNSKKQLVSKKPMAMTTKYSTASAIVLKNKSNTSALTQDLETKQKGYVGSTVQRVRMRKLPREYFTTGQITNELPPKPIHSEDDSILCDIMDVDNSSAAETEGNKGNDSDSSWSMSSKESVDSREPMTARSRSSTAISTSTRRKKCNTPAHEPVQTRETVSVRRCPVRKASLLKLPPEYFTIGRKVNEEKSPKPQKKRGRPPRKVSDGNDSNNEVESADPKPQRRKASNRVRSMEEIGAKRIRGRADYWRKLGNAEKITHKPCPHCGKVMRNKSKFALEIHIRLQHKHIGYYSCGICGKPYDAISAKEEHEKTHLSTAERIELRKAEARPSPKWLCPECGKVFASQASLNAHSKTHANDAMRRLRCEEINCDYTAVCRKSMRRHVERVHNASASPRYKCKVCSKEFQVFNDIKHHAMTTCDAANRPFTCDQGTCPFRFKLKQGLLQHLHTAHPFTVEEARQKLYPGLPCPDWVAGKYPRKKKFKSGGVRTRTAYVEILHRNRNT